MSRMIEIHKFVGTQLNQTTVCTFNQLFVNACDKVSFKFKSIINIIIIIAQSAP